MRKVKPKDKRNKINAKNNKITNIVPCCRISAGIAIIFSSNPPYFPIMDSAMAAASDDTAFPNITTVAPAHITDQKLVCIPHN